MRPYGYSPLMDCDIRLVRILQNLTSEGYSQLECRHFLFDDALITESELLGPVYTALSYTWGAETPTFDLSIDGCSFRVRHNLYEFFKTTYELGESDKWFWIDQICIDQHNIPERNMVVQNMEHIYSKAEVVRVWLGERNQQTDIAFTVFADFKDIELTYRASVQDPNREDDYAERKRSYFETRPAQTDAIYHFFDRLYWERQWIIQEIWLAPRLCLQCGNARWTLEDAVVDDNAVHSTINAWCQFKSLDSGASMRIFGRRLGYGCRFLGPPFDTLYQALRAFRGECKDPRDKVYGLLGLLPPEARVIVDYAQAVTEVFWQAVVNVYKDGELQRYLDLSAMQVLLELMTAMDLETDVGSDALSKYVEQIYKDKGWEWPPAKTEEDPRWWNEMLGHKRSSYSAVSRFDWSKGDYYELDEYGRFRIVAKDRVA